MTKLHEAHNVEQSVVQMVKDMVREGYYRLDNEGKGHKLNELALHLSQYYNVPTLFRLVISSQLGCQYIGAFNIISIDKPSIISFLHEYRHHLQNHMKGLDIKINLEYDAQAWACSIFYKACPDLFTKAVKEGRVMALGFVEGEIVNTI